jgi:D-serine deaminase-like pyridoxal phosphate-dependent protein
VTPERLDTLAARVRGRSLPALLLDLDAFDRNVAKIRDAAQKAGKPLRIASKSLRCPELQARILRSNPAGMPRVFQGVLTYSLAESLYLAERHDPAQEGPLDLLLAYPSLETDSLPRLAETLRKHPGFLTVMVDDRLHLEFWADFCKRHSLTQKLPICIDLDQSYRVSPSARASVHLGVRRSPIRTTKDLELLLRELRSFPSLELRGLMGYEAQIAGLPDRNPFHPLLNAPKKLIKALSVRDVAQKRRAALECVQEHLGKAPAFFNGGGTGSLRTTGEDPSVTELTAGSGFFQSHLFDYYEDSFLEPALYFALRVTRAPEPGVVTCQSGGFIASGEIGPEKAPVPVYPLGLEPFPTEGFGEVQTPFRVPRGLSLSPGEVVLCRPAKAGEVTEHFHEILAFSKDQPPVSFATYRGLGHTFR